MSTLPRLATSQHRGMVRLECATSTAPLVVLLDASGPGGDAFADLRARLPGVPIWAAVPPTGQPAWMWPWDANETRYIEDDPAPSALERVLGWVKAPLDLVIVAPGNLVSVDSLPRLGSLVRPFLLVDKPPAEDILAELTKLGGGYLLRGSVPTPRLSLTPRPGVTLDVSTGPRDISLPHHEWITPTFTDVTWFDAHLVAPWAGYELHVHHTASARSPEATDIADAPTGALPVTKPRDALDPKDGVAEGHIVFVRGGERVTRPLHRVTELRSASVELSLIVEGATKIWVSATRGPVMVRNKRVDPQSPMSVISREPFFIDGVMTHVEVTSFTGSTRPAIVQGEGKKTIVGAFVISGTPIDFIERDPTRHELWVHGASLHVRGRLRYAGVHEKVDTFPDQARLDLSWLWDLARANTITGHDRMPFVLTGVRARTQLALEFDIKAGTLTILGEYDIAVE